MFALERLQPRNTHRTLRRGTAGLLGELKIKRSVACADCRTKTARREAFLAEGADGVEQPITHVVVRPGADDQGFREQPVEKLQQVLVREVD